MKTRLASPEHLIDLSGITSLKGIRREGDKVVIGAMTTQYEIIHSDVLIANLPILRETSFRLLILKFVTRGQ